MAIIKKSWIEILQENNVGDYSLAQEGLRNLLVEVDGIFTSQYKFVEGANDMRMTNIFDEIVTHFVTNTSANNYWKDMPVWLSSYNFKNKTPFGEIVLRLTQYLGFYKKVLTDKGLARSVVTHREYTNNGHSEGINQSVRSDTPQSNIESFDEMIAYVSEANKNNDSTTSNTDGESDLTITSKSFDEEEKNLKLIFYNDLCDYIRRIPQWIYSQYALDSLPAKAIVEETFNYFKQLYECR